MVRALLLGFPMTTQIEGLFAPAMLPLAARPRPGEAPTLDRIRGNAEGWCLRAGHQGDSVAELRALLRSAGYALPPGNTVDGETERAIRAFQERAGLVVDGKAGVRTLEALEHVRANPPLIAASQQAGAARALGDTLRALAPATRGPIADGAYLNPATGQLVMARPTIPGEAGAQGRSSPGLATIPAAEGGGIGGLLGPAIAAARTPAAVPAALLAPRQRLLNELGEPIGPRAAPTTPPLVGPDLEPLRPAPRAPAPRLLLPDEVLRPAAPPPPLVRPDLEPLRPAARAPAPRLLLPDEVLRPTAPLPPLVRPDLEPLRPGPRPAAPRLIVPEGALDVPVAPRAAAAPAPAPAPRPIEHGEGLDRLYRETANRSLAQQGAGVQLERGQTLQDLVNEQKISPAQRRVAQQAFETLTTDGAYRDAANAALERQGNPARLRPGETLSTLFERGEINRPTLNVAREAALDTGFARSVEHQAGAAPARAPAAPEPGMLERAAARARGAAETVRTAELSPGAATALRYGGRGLMAVGAVLDAADVVGAVQADAARGDGRNVETIRTSGRVAGGWLGAAGGAALAGAAAGTIVPGLGNVAGFLVGAAGGAIGYWLGSGAGEAVGTAVAG